MKNQRGISFWGFIWAAAFLISAIVIGIRSIPPYHNNFKIQQALNVLAEEPNAINASRLTLLSSLKKRLYIDYADQYVNLDKAFRIKKIKNGKELVVKYEVVVPLVGNAFLLFDFKNKVNVSG